jgi:molybdopterin molybdotransferase
MRMSSTIQSAGVLSFEQAYRTVLDYCRQIPLPLAEETPLPGALGRVLADTVSADRDLPPFHRATRDGYAVRSADLKDVPARLRVIGKIKAGAGFAGRVNSSEVVEIMTGAALPEGTDAVVMVEHTSRLTGSDQVEIQRGIVAGDNVVPAGAEARKNQPLLAPGTRLGPAQMALAAACGMSRLNVYLRPRVAILTTGDELVEVAETPGPQQIRNSNSYSLAAQVEAAGGEAMRLPAAPDELKKLTILIHAGLAADMLLLSGGVSMGEFDLVEQALSNLGAEFFFTGALIQPGRPVVFGEVKFAGDSNGARKAGGARDPGPFARPQLERKAIPFLGLPGNPISTMVTFDLFARPVLQALSGATPERLPSAKARLKKDCKTKTGLTRFLPAILEGGWEDPEVELVPWQGSGDLLASAKANCYLVIPPDREAIAAGEIVSILLRS